MKSSSISSNTVDRDFVRAILFDLLLTAPITLVLYCTDEID